MWLPASKSFFDRLAIVDLTGSLIPDTKDCCALSSDPSNVEPTRGSALHRVDVPNIPGEIGPSVENVHNGCSQMV